MKKGSYKTYILWILLSEAVGILSGWLTREGVELYQATAQQPALAPPGIVFPIVWTVLYALMGIGAARVDLSPDSKSRTRGLFFFLIQLAFNFFWSLIFFRAQNYGFALIWLIALWLLILMMILSFRKVDKLAAWLQLPYLLWVTFAVYLNYSAWMLNR